MLRRIRLLLAALAVALASFFVPSALASEGRTIVSITPSEQEIELTPGQQYTESVTVYNVGTEAFDFEVDVAPYQVNDDYSDPDFSTTNAYTNIINWITFPETHYTVTPDHSARVDFNIDVPEDVPGGGQYAAIIIRAVNPESEADTPVKIVAQLAALIYAHVKGPAARESGFMTEHNIPGFLLGREFRITSVFENDGNVDYKVAETLTVRDFFTGRELVNPDSVTEDGYNFGTVEAVVLPDTERRINMVWPNAPQLGVFRVSQVVFYFGKKYFYEQIVIVCPVWLPIIVAVAILLLVLVFITYARNRRLNRPQVF